MATWRWCEKIDLQVTYRHSSNLANVERKHNSDWDKTSFEKSQGDEMPQNSQEWLSAFFWKRKSEIQKQKTTANLRIVYFSAFQFLAFPTNISLKMWRTNSSLCCGEKDLNKVDAHRKRVNIHLGHPLCDNVTWKPLPNVKAFFPGRDTKAFATMVQKRWWQWQCCWAKCQLLQSAWTPSSRLPGWNIPSVLRIQVYWWWGS